MIEINRNFLDVAHLKSVKDWIYNCGHLKDFSSSDDKTRRSAFAATFTAENLPVHLKHYVNDETNVYNFISIITTSSGAIDMHVDDDLTCHMKSIGIPNMFIKLPHSTDIFYVDVSESMTGGQLICHDMMIAPETNMLVRLLKNTPHAVASINDSDSPRVVLVCERYRLLKSTIKTLNTPLYRDG